MKCIAKINSDKYVCEVDHKELEKFLNMYYGKLPALNIDQEINLGRGYDFSIDIKDSLEAIKRFVEKSGTTIDAIQKCMKIPKF